MHFDLDDNFDSQYPSWLYFWLGLSMFIYETLDAIDGKQARRTDSSSALGHLFDHGCDAFITCFMIYGCARTCGIKPGQEKIAQKQTKTSNCKFYFCRSSVDLDAGICGCIILYYGVEVLLP